MLAQTAEDISDPNVGVEIYDRFNQLIYSVSAIHLNCKLPPLRRGDAIVVSFQIQMSVAPGPYTLAILASDNSNLEEPNVAVHHDRHYDLGPLNVFWNKALLPFYGVAALQSEAGFSALPSYDG
jgi:hypothetical protein